MAKSEPLTMSVPEAADALGVSRHLCYSLARQRRIPVICLGRRLVVPRAAFLDFLAGRWTPSENGDGHAHQ